MLQDYDYKVCQIYGGICIFQDYFILQYELVFVKIVDLHFSINVFVFVKLTDQHLSTL